MAKTKRQYFNEIKAVVAGNAELVAFIDHEIELLDNKNRKSDKPTKRQEENSKIKESIYNAMESGTKYRVSEVVALVPELSQNRAVALMTQMKDAGKLERELVKGVAYFSKA